ncbi:MAG: M15 family metallopeptidase [Spirochaeta sp.]|nr:M15 family metallopeptidase [Spirochaeta sp.]
MTPSLANPDPTGHKRSGSATRGRFRRHAHTAGVVTVVLSVTAGVAGGVTGCTPGDGGRTAADATDTEITAETSAEAPLHPAFSLTQGDLEAISAGLPAEPAAAIRNAPERFLDTLAPVLETAPDLLPLVDKTHLLPADYEPDDLVPLTTYADRLTLNKDDLSLRAALMPDLLAMVDAAAAEGITLDISSSYRSYAYQEWLFGYWVEQLGREEAERVSARPGSSQHQLGTTLDFGSVTVAFAEHPAGIWLAENAWRFGFSLSYPAGYESLTGYACEPWHFRWITPAATALEREFFGGLQQVMLEFLAEHGAALRHAYTG